MGFVLIGLGSLTDSGLSGAMLQMVSHGLIGASLFFLAGVTYDRTRTLILEDLGGLAVQMPKVFAMFTAVSLASLALPGMSGFISELMIFLGFVTSESYSYEFREVLTLLEAIGIVLTPIYLLSMLRQVFYGSKRGDAVGIGHSRTLIDAGPREIFVVVCLMVPMIGIGLYPKMLTQIYEARTNAVVEHVQKSRDYVATKATLWT
jgi:NAD(P)H-quinone oxidoreductase subunit 4